MCTHMKDSVDEISFIGIQEPSEMNVTRSQFFEKKVVLHFKRIKTDTKNIFYVLCSKSIETIVEAGFTKKETNNE